MAKNYLVTKENCIDLALLVKSKEIGSNFFSASSEIKKIIEDVIQFYAKNACNGD
jgi:hypothetical protein